MELTDEMLSAHAALARDLWLATLLWTDGPVIYQLSGNLPTEELIAIAEKIKILQN